MEKSKSINNRGFMLVETILVSLTVSAVLIYMYIQFSSLSDSYRAIGQYNTVEGLYRADVVKHFLMLNTTKKLPNDTTQQDPLYASLGNGKKIVTCTGGGCNCTAIPPTLNRKSHRITYFCDLAKLMELKYVILAPGPANYASIRSSIVATGSNVNPALRDYMKILTPGQDGYYRIIIEYNDGSFASLLYKPWEQ